MVPEMVRSLDFKILFNEIHSFESLNEFIMSIIKTSRLAESFTWMLIVAFVAGIVVGSSIGDSKSSSVNLNSGLGFRAKPSMEQPEKFIRSIARARLMPLIILCSLLFSSWNRNGSVFDSQIGAHNFETESDGALPNAFDLNNILWIHDNYVSERLQKIHGLGQTSISSNT